ncbi:MAG TPA: hypothetical protein VGP41_03600 [Candidatus Lustribacter sp.]|jgi:hypothetical protein|nr:hypothetical protein [Candidatus Lustribacter sp.]
MARISTVVCTSHSPWLFAQADEWVSQGRERYADGVQRPKVPTDTPEVSNEKHARCMRAFDVLREHVAAKRPDVLIIFGDDQTEQFTFKNLPAFNIFVGPQFEGWKISHYLGMPKRGKPREARAKTAANWTSVDGHPELARALTVGLMDRGFDVSYSLELNNPEEGMGHAIMRAATVLTPEYDVPVIPFLVNCCYGPSPRGRRCYELGRALRETIEAIPLDLSVAVVGSGGLWHMLRAPEPIIDEHFDHAILSGVRTGNARAIADVLDGYAPPVDLGDAGAVKYASNGSGMVLGIGHGSGEVRNWITAAAVADGMPGTVVDYVPIYASPIGVAFAYWEQV